MIRTTFLAVALLAAPAAAQTPDEVNQLKARVESLEAKLKAAERENESLKRELESLRKPGGKPAAADPLAVGTRFAGTITRTWTNGTTGKQEVHSNSLAFHVTKRSGDTFVAEHTDAEKNVTVFEGTVDSNNVVKFKITKAPKLNGSSVIGISQFSGRIDNGELTGTVTKPKVDPTYKGEFKLKAK